MRGKIDTMDSSQVIEEMRRRTDTVLLSMSCGKDAVAAWLSIHGKFRVIPFYLYLVPDLEFVERGIRYYENFFGARIIRVPHPSLYRMLNEGVFQPPDRMAWIERCQLPDFDYEDVENGLREDYKLGPEVYTASGVRAADSPDRLTAFRRWGPIVDSRKKFYPIWDWKKDQLIREIERAGVKLTEDYQVFGRSFDGLDYRFLEPIRRTWPRDYERILEWFPLADLEIQRRAYVGAC